eukprot:s7957_g1.t1
MARYSKLLGTLSSRIDATGLHVAEADLVAVLLRSLPDAVRTFCLHHTGGETYQAFRTTALRWEQQQRAFAEFHPRRNLYQVEASVEEAAHYDMSASDGDGNWNLDAVGGVKCGTCGSRKHSTHACDVDLSKLKCFKCNKYGHISANCPERKKGKGDNRQVIKGKGKQKGKKGKGDRIYCTCMNCARKGDSFGASLERSQWLAWKLRHFEASLPPSVFLDEPQFYEEPELIFVHDSDSECSLVIDEVLGDEVDASDSEEETLTCRLWDINFGWTPESASSSDAALLCGMLNIGCCEPQSADNNSSCSTAKQTLHEPPFFGEH